MRCANKQSQTTPSSTGYALEQVEQTLQNAHRAPGQKHAPVQSRVLSEKAPGLKLPACASCSEMEVLGAFTLNGDDVTKKNGSKGECALPGPPIALEQERGYMLGAWEFSRRERGYSL